MPVGSGRRREDGNGEHLNSGSSYADADDDDDAGGDDDEDEGKVAFFRQLLSMEIITIVVTERKHPSN